MNKKKQKLQKKSVYFFCMDIAVDEVAPRVFEASLKLFDLRETSMTVDGFPVLSHTAADGSVLYYARTKTDMCMTYDRYVPIVNELFGDCDIAVMVNWHGGANAPDRVLCIHTVGDVTSATFGPSSPAITTNLARKLEQYRAQLELEDFTVTTEATHWSGIVYGGNVEWITDCTVPFLDVEIGSTSESYANPKAAEVIARALAAVYDGVEEMLEVPVALYCGGIHFEETISKAVLHPTHPVALTHILPSRWIENEKYSGYSGLDALKRCVDSIPGGIDGIVVHEKLDRLQRDLITEFAEQEGLPVIKRKSLKVPQETIFYC